MVILPGLVEITVLGVTFFCSSASATVTGFMVEPGSKISVRARLRNCSPVRFLRLLGS